MNPGDRQGKQMMSPRKRRLLVRAARLAGIRWVQHGFRQRKFREILSAVATTILFLVLPSLAFLIPSDWNVLIGIAALFVAMPIHIWFLSSRDKRTAREFEAKKCPICGYDLRASRRKCPECGNVVRTKPLQQPKSPAQKRAPVPKIELPKGFFSGLAAFAVGYSANDHGRLTDALSLSQSRRGRIELLICLVICPLLSLIALVIMIAVDQETIRETLIVPAIAIFPGSLWVLGHVHRLQKHRVHNCPLCGENFRGIQRVCPSCGGHSEVTDAPTLVTKRVQNLRDLRSMLHSPRGRMELLVCLIVCPVIGIVMIVGACKASLNLSGLTFGLLLIGGFFITSFGFVWLIGRVAFAQVRQRHACRACGRKFKEVWKCPQCGSVDVIALDASPDILRHRPSVAVQSPAASEGALNPTSVTDFRRLDRISDQPAARD